MSSNFQKNLKGKKKVYLKATPRDVWSDISIFKRQKMVSEK